MFKKIDIVLIAHGSFLIKKRELDISKTFKVNINAVSTISLLQFYKHFENKRRFIAVISVRVERKEELKIISTAVLKQWLLLFFLV